MKEKVKVVFILNGIYKSRRLKRIEEFIDNGYDVEAYGFSWDTDIPNVSEKFSVEVIGHQSVRYSYRKRLSIIVKSLRKILPTAMMNMMEMVGRSRGMVMYLTCCHLVEPSISAASYSSPSMPLMEAI